MSGKEKRRVDVPAAERGAVLRKREELSGLRANEKQTLDLARWRSLVILTRTVLVEHKW